MPEKFRACIIIRKVQFFLEFSLHIHYNNTAKKFQDETIRRRTVRQGERNII